MPRSGQKHKGKEGSRTAQGNEVLVSRERATGGFPSGRSRSRLARGFVRSLSRIHNTLPLNKVVRRGYIGDDPGDLGTPHD